MACRTLRVRGRVQGVGFRDACVDAARRAGLAGWVRNRGDGSVELLIAGESAQLDAFTAWLRHGVPLARVDAIESIDAAGSVDADLRSLDGFERRPTA